jgi:hypothetical protein
MDLEHRIRERAYAIWEAEGRVAGYEHDHWRRAERELHTIAQAPAAATSAAKPSTAPKGKKSAASAGAIAKAKRSGAKAQVLHS